MTFVLFDYIDNGILKTMRGHLNGKADRAEGLLRLRDTDTSLITFREQKTYAYLKQTVPAGSDIGRGRSSTLDVVPTLGRIWPDLRRRHGRKDLHLKGGSQRRAWALDGRVKPLDLG
jgi:hypothetical protein